METDQHEHPHHQHDHAHPHGHDHSHEDGHDHGSAEQLPGPSGAGSVVLDIGGDVGALALSTPDSLAGVEIEIRPVGAPWLGQHVAVRERVLPDRTVYAALFPSLTAGDYELRVRFGEPDAATMVVNVDGGGVTRATWT